MNEAPRSDEPAPMEGKGFYNRSSRVQAAGLSPAVPLLEQAARSTALPRAPEPIVIADYGSSEGRNSLGPMAAAIAALRERAGHERAVSVVHTDLPGNDFAALFQALADDPGSYLRDDPAAYASAVGRSYFAQILPANSVTLGWSSWAVQWLSRTPAVIPDQVQVAFSQDAAAHAAYEQQAADDWRTFLAMRSHELRPGGKLVVLTMAMDDTGDFGYRPLLEAMYASLLELVDDGLVRSDELRHMAIPTVGRRREAFEAPFAAGGGVDELSLEHLEVFNGDDRIFAQFEASRDARAFGAQWAAFSRASVFPTMATALQGYSRDARTATFVDRLEALLAARLAAAPSRMTIPLAQMVIAKAG